MGYYGKMVVYGIAVEGRSDEGDDSQSVYSSSSMARREGYHFRRIKIRGDNAEVHKWGKP